MIRRYLITAFTLFNAMQLVSYAQSDTLTIKAIAAKVGNAPTEHIYLHLNKPRYERGDTIWFRLYNVTNGHKLSAVSHTAFAELIGLNDTVIQKLNLRLEAGMTSGDFALPLILNPGTYHIRAYTNWILQHDEENIYDREVIIGNPYTLTTKIFPKAKTFPTTSTLTTATTDLQFFPEGGELVEGLRNVVAFKATNPDGSPAVFTGNITGIDGQVMADLQSNASGTGMFAICPEPNVNYMANVTFANGRTQTVNLPKAIAAGYTLTVNSFEKDTLQIKIAANEALLKNVNGENFYLVAQSGGRVYYTTTGKTDVTAYKIRIPKNRFPTGITSLTLYAQSGEPLNERVVFIRNNDNLNLKLDPQSLTNLNQSVTISAVTQKDKSPVIGSFSAAVFNEDKVPFDERTEPTIFTTLLLSDELHGKITNPAHYLADANDMDLLMLTQGYRKLEWKKQADSTQQTIAQYQNEDGLTLSGTVTDNKGRPVAGGKVSLLSTNPIVKLDTLTDSKGRFAFTGLDVEEQIKFLLKAQNGKSNEVKIALDKPKPEKETFGAMQQVAIIADTAASKELQAAIQNSYREEEQNYEKLRGKQLKEVVIKEKYDPQKKLEEELEGSANLNGPGHADQIVMGKDLVNMGCPILAKCLKIKFFQVDASPLGGPLYDISRGHHNIIGAGPITVFVDGTIADLNNVVVEDIYSIELLTSAKYKAIYGHDAAGGLLLITTKRGIPKNELIPVEREPGLISFTYNGYYKARTFYHAKYDVHDALNQPSAIYWKPDILTDKDGKATLNFNNAGKGHYRVVVEGIDGDGHLGRAVYKYIVE